MKLEAIVRRFLLRHRPRHEHELSWFRTQPWQGVPSRDVAVQLQARLSDTCVQPFFTKDIGCWQLSGTVLSYPKLGHQCSQRTRQEHEHQKKSRLNRVGSCPFALT